MSRPLSPSAEEALLEQVEEAYTDLLRFFKVKPTPTLTISP